MSVTNYLVLAIGLAVAQMLIGIAQIVIGFMLWRRK